MRFPIVLAWRRPLRRLGSLVLILAAIACFFACIYGLNWIWTVKQPAISTATYTFDQALDWLAIADSAMNDVNHNLERSRKQMLDVQTTLGTSAAARPGAMQSIIARGLVREMAPDINDVQHTVEKVTEASIVINSILGSLEEVPADAGRKLDTDQVRALQRQVVSVTRASWELGNLLNDTDGSSGETPHDKAARIAASLKQILEVSREFQGRVTALRDRIRQIRADTLYWMNVTPTLATAALGWVAFTQLVVIIYLGRDLVRGRN